MSTDGTNYSRGSSGITRRDCLAYSAAAAFGVAAAKRDAAAEQQKVSPTRLDWRIWDNHCHLAGVAGSTPAARMQELLRVADRLGIERLVVYMGWPFQTDPSADELRRQNDQVLEAIRGQEKRVLAYAYVTPQHLETSLEEIQRCVAEGPMVGIKLWVARRCDDKDVDAIVAATAKQDAVIFQHTWIKTTGNLTGESTPNDLVKLAARHPQAKFICGHAGGNWELGIRGVRAANNIALGIAGSDPTAGLVEMAVRELGAERVIYGSDVAGRSFASQLGKVLSADLPDAAKRQILGGNLRRLLQPILERKGIAQ